MKRKYFARISSFVYYNILQGFPGAAVVKNPPANAGHVESIPGWKDPLEEEIATHSSILGWEPHGQKSLVGYSQWSHKELDMTEQLNNNMF